MQPHHIEIRSADHPRPDLTRLAKTDHGEADGGEITERAQRLDTLAQVLDLWHGERRVVHAGAMRRLADVDQPVLVAIDQRPQQYAAHQTEDRGISADAQRQREHHGDRKPFGPPQRTNREFHLAQKGHQGFTQLRTSAAISHTVFSFSKFQTVSTARRIYFYVERGDSGSTNLGSFFNARSTISALATCRISMLARPRVPKKPAAMLIASSKSLASIKV